MTTRRPTLPRLATRDAVAPSGNRELFLEDQFRQFRELSTEFVQSLATQADFSTDGSGKAAPRVNLGLVRSIFGKWTIDILVLFHTETQLGFGELKKALPGISSRVLSSKLKRLEGMGLVRREVLSTHPPRVNYALTERGLTVTRLGEPVLLFLRVSQGLYVDPSRASRSGAVRGSDSDNPR